MKTRNLLLGLLTVLSLVMFIATKSGRTNLDPTTISGPLPQTKSGGAELTAVAPPPSTVVERVGPSAEGSKPNPAVELSEDELYNKPGPQPPSPGRRLWRFRRSLQKYQMENANVSDGLNLLKSSIAAILHSQGMAVESNENPALIAAWGRRKEGSVLCVNEVTCFVNFSDFPELLEAFELAAEHPHLPLRSTSSHPLPEGAPVAPVDLDQNIARLAQEALRRLVAAAAAA